MVRRWFVFLQANIRQTQLCLGLCVFVMTWAAVATTSAEQTVAFFSKIYLGSGSCLKSTGSGSPEGVVTGNVCDEYSRTDGGANTTLYVKESGTGNTGWAAKVSGGAGVGDFSSNTATSVDGEVLLFSGTGGKTGKRATGTGFAKLASGVLSAAANIDLVADVSSTILPFANGGTGLSSASDDTVMVSSGSAWQAKAVPDCDDSGGNHLNYDTGTNAWSCGTSGGGGGGSLDAITNAAGDATRSHGDNNIVWNWQKTTDNEYAFTFGESSASTNGTTVGALQGILRINTLSTSTATAVRISNFGTANSFYIEDVSSDTSPFVLDAAGFLGVGTQPSFPLHIAGSSSGTIARLTSVSGTSLNFYTDSSIGSIATTSAIPLWLATNSVDRFMVRSGGGVGVTRSGGVPTSVTNANAYLNLGLSGDGGANTFYAIGYGYAGGTNPAAWSGYEITDNSNNSKGRLLFATRADVTDSAATTRLIIDDQGTLILPTTAQTPAVSNTSANSCGTTAATIAGNNNVGTITVGATSGTSCTVTFTTTAPAEWVCIVNNATSANLVRATPTTTTTSVFAGTFAAADQLNYMCFAR